PLIPSRPGQRPPSARVPESPALISVCARHPLRESRPCILQVSWQPLNFGLPVQRVVSDRKFLFPVERVHETLRCGALPEREFQRRADRTLFRSRRACAGCFLFQSEVFLYCYRRSAKRLTALTPLSLFIDSLDFWGCE